MKNKAKLLTYILTMSLSTTTLGGCGYLHMDGLSYSVDENDENVVNGTINYQDLKGYKVVELRFLDGQNRLIIANKIKDIRTISGISDRYIEIDTGKSIYYKQDDSITIVNEINLDGFLSVYNEIKPSYTIEDIERIYNKIVENYEFTTDKVLEK